MEPFSALGADALGAVLNTASTLYLANQKKKQEEEMRRRQQMLLAQDRMGEASKFGYQSQEQAIKQMLAGFTGALES